MAARIKLGLVGAEQPRWVGIADSLTRMPRLEICGVFDPCLAKAALAARRLQTTFYPSLRALLRACQGLILADAGWMRTEPVILATANRIPVLLLQGEMDSIRHADLERMRHHAALTGTMLMPELPHRWTRSTLRLRELAATTLGPIEQLTVQCRTQGPTDLLIAIDCCGDLMQSDAQTIEVSDERIRIHYRRRQADGKPIFADLIPAGSGLANAQLFDVLEARCRKGSARLLDEQTLEWTSKGPVQREFLNSDRPARDVMLDLFGRRVAGGLIPVPGLDDLIRGRQLAEAISRTDEGILDVESVLG